MNPELLTCAHRDGLLFDGAMGSMLIAAGVDRQYPSEHWNLAAPETVGAIHSAYLDAGADVITTNSFGGSRLKLQKSGDAGQVREINRQAACIARECAGNSAWVAGDIGPSGEMLAPYGMISETEMTANFAEQARALAEGGVDLFIVETMFDLNEALSAVRGIREVSDKPVFATLTFESKPTGFVTLMGNRVREATEALAAAGVAAVGANCSLGSEQMIGLAREMRASVAGLIIIQPNAGQPRVTTDGLEYPESPVVFADNLLRIKSLRIEIIGGCCGSTPEYIRQIARRIKKS